MAETNIVDNSALQATPPNLGIPISEPIPVEPPKDVTPDEPVVIEPEVGEPVGDVTVISDKEAQEKTEENLVKLEADIGKVEGPEPLAVEGIGVVGTDEGVFRNPETGQLERFSNVDINAEQILNRGLEFVAGQDISAPVRQTQEAKRKGLTPDELSKLGVTTPEEDEINKARQKIEDERNTLVGELDKIRATADAASKALIDSIKSSFDVRERQMKDVNKTALETLRILGIRSGRQRFAAEVQTGILSAEERAGVQRLADLDVQEKQLIAEAQLAATANDFELLNSKITLTEEVRKEKLKVLEEQLGTSKELEELAIKKASEAREAEKFTIEKKQDLVSEVGIIALNSLTGDETADARLIEQLALANEIEPQALLAEILRQDQELSEGAGDFKFISQTAKQQGGSFNSKTGIFTPRTGGIGGLGGTPGRITEADLDSASNDELTTITRVMRLLPTKLKDSEQERTDRQVEILRGIRGGQTIQDMVDEIKGFVITNEKQQNFATYLRTLAAGTDIDLSDLAAVINRGNTEKAMTIVENENLKEVDGELKNVASARTLVEGADRVLDLLEKAPVDNLGAFNGRTFKVKRFAGLTDTEIVATQNLETAMVNLLNEIRRKSLGTAVTESEIAFLSPLLTDVLDQPEIVKAKMGELKEGTLINHNAARSQATLPEVTEDELTDNKLRLELYNSAADASNRMQIRIKDTGETGSIDISEFNPETMEKI